MEVNVCCLTIPRLLNHVLKFLATVGRPVLQPNSVVRSEILITMCNVRRGKLVHRWSRKRCLLCSDSIRIQKDVGDDDILSLSRCRVDVCETRHGRCIRLEHSSSVILLHFDDPDTLTLWSTRCRQSSQRKICDLSDRKLTLLPESLLSSGCDQIEQLNLRRNSLSTRNANHSSTVQLGWLDDLSRLSSLTFLDLSSNCLSTFPASLAQLANLERLNMSSNCIQTVPSNVKFMKRLRSLNLENNWISTLPSQLAECENLKCLNLKFNRIKQIPEDVLIRLPLLKQWSLAGNYIEYLSTDQLMHIDKLDLRRNALCSCFRLPSSCFDQLTFLDIRDNWNVSTVHLTNLPSLQVLHCERLQLASLHLNGQNLTHLHAHHNMLDCLIVMPVPLHLVFIDISHNNFDSLPDWICDLPQIECLRVHNNRLTNVPNRLFSVQSMRHLCCKNNRIKSLPNPTNHLNLVSCILYNNQLTELPPDFLWKCSSALTSLSLLEELNLSSNELTALSPSIFKLPALQVLKAHSNHIKSIPDLSLSPTLQILDLSNNALGKCTTYIDTGCSLNLLDLTCNSALSFTSGCLRENQKKPVTLYDIGDQTHDRVLMGFSETSGNRNKLCIRRVHCGEIFGMVDGSSNYELPQTIQSILERSILNTNHDINLSEILLGAHEALEEPGERLGASCLLIHLGAELSVSCVGNIGAAVLTGGHLEKLTGSEELDEEEYERIRCAGGTVDENNLVNGATLNSRQLGFYSFHPVLTPKPTEKSILITKEMDYVIIASWAVWEFLNDAQISSILVSSLNPQVAAKTIQDSLQACDYNGNSCVMVIRLLKPELSFRSTSNESVGCSTSISMVIPPMRVEQRKTQEDALPKIEQKLEKISDVIAKMDDEAAVQNDGYLSGRQLYNRIVAHEKVSNWIVSPNSSGAAPPPDPTYSGHSEFVNELKSRVGCVDFIQDRNEVSVVPQHPQNKQENISNLQYNNTVPLSKNLKGTMRQQCSPANSDVTSSAKYLRFPRLTSRQKQHSEITRPMSSKSKCLVGVYQYDDGLSINTDKHSHASPATSEDPWIERVVSRITHKHGAVYSLCSPATSSSSEFYSITKARKERRLASSEKFRRSFDYYSHTQIRPYSDAHEVLESPSVSGSDFFTPIRSMTPHLENTLPYNKRMSVIEEEVHQKFPSED